MGITVEERRFSAASGVKQIGAFSPRRPEFEFFTTP